MVKMLSGACAGYCVYCGEKLFIQNWSIFRKTAFIYLFIFTMNNFLFSKMIADNQTENLQLQLQKKQLSTNQEKCLIDAIIF